MQASFQNYFSSKFAVPNAAAVGAIKIWIMFNAD